MATLRQDPTTNEWVIVAPERAARPMTSRAERIPVREHDGGCPFCPGNEHLTPPEITRSPAGPRWEIRVVPNRYPALGPGGSTDRRGEACSREMDGVGSHEVIVESPHHDERLDEMGLDRLAAVLATWRDRYRALSREPWAKAVVVFKNFGEGAGTSLVHPHSQVVATPVFPPDSLHRYAVATRYYDDTGHCVYLDLLDQELRDRERVVVEGDAFVAVSPFASRLPFETWVAPRLHQTSFAHLGDDDVPELAAKLREVLGALRRAADDPDYNLIVDSAPVAEESKPFFQWHIRVLPRMVTAAGFELGSGMAINSVVPEEAARLLREAITPAAVR